MDNVRTLRTRDLAKRGRGRPPKPAGEAKRAFFNTRLRASTKDALDSAAAERGRSLSEEIEARLDESIDRDARYGGPLGRGFMEMVGAVIEHVYHRTGKSWLDDDMAYSGTLLAFQGMLGRLGAKSAEARKFLLLHRRAQGLQMAIALLKFAGYSDVEIGHAVTTLPGLGQGE
jgi:hypothetical protein